MLSSGVHLGKVVYSYNSVLVAAGLADVPGRDVMARADIQGAADRTARAAGGFYRLVAGTSQDDFTLTPAPLPPASPGASSNVSGGISSRLVTQVSLVSSSSSGDGAAPRGSKNASVKSSDISS